MFGRELECLFAQCVYNFGKSKLVLISQKEMAILGKNREKGGCSLFPQGKLAPVPPNSMYTLCRWVGLPSCHSCDYGWCGSAVDSPIYPVKLDTHVLPSFLIETVGEQQCELGYYLGNRLS